MTDITRSLGVVKVLKKASLNLKSGEVLDLLEKNDVGKSILMNILSSSLHPDESEILVV